jgi:hypothetical protein
MGVRAAAGAPIIVDGDVWGAMTATAGRAPLPDPMEDRLAAFTELVAGLSRRSGGCFPSSSWPWPATSPTAR